MLGFPRLQSNRALCSALLATSLAACGGGNVVFDLADTDSGTSPVSAADGGANGGGNNGSGNNANGSGNNANGSGNNGSGNNANGSGNNGSGNNANGSGNNGPADDAGGNTGATPDAGGNGGGTLDAGGTTGATPDAGGGTLDAGGGTGATPDAGSAIDAGPSTHPLAGSYAVRTVIYARQKADVAGTPLDIVSEGTLLSIANISDTGLVTEHYCFIETANVEGIYSWTQPAATENIPNSVVQLVQDGNAYVRAQAGDRSYVSWSPAAQPSDCVQGQTHSTGCLCGDAAKLPVDSNDCRVSDLDADSAPGGALYVGVERPTDPAASTGLVKLNIVGEKAIEWRIDATQSGPKLVGAITGGIEQSELSREGDPALLELFGRIRNSVCPGSYGHVELVPGNFTCASVLAGRATDVDGYGLFNTALDSNLSTENVTVCPDPDACATGVDKDACGVCGGPGIPANKCNCTGADPTTWYSDADGDGLGDATAPLTACTQPSGYVGNNTDTDVGCATTRDACNVCGGSGIPAGQCDCAGTLASTWYSDSDGDGFGDPASTLTVCAQPSGYVSNAADGCPANAAKAAPGSCGCATADTDSDGDGLANCNDACPDDSLKTTVGQCGCGVAETNSDGDALPDCTDGCDSDANKVSAGICGCGTADTNTDGDAQADCEEECDNDPAKVVAGACGCGVADTNSDGDSVPDCNDGCPADAGKTSAGTCGCGTPDTNSDGDSQLDCNEACDNDATKTDPGICGCGLADIDRTGDGNVTVADCTDACPSDPNKFVPGVCGCGTADTNSDGDSQLDCNEDCDTDPNKLTAGACGCGVADTNTDGDSQADCNEDCDSDPNKTAAGICGCGLADIDRTGDGSVTSADCTDACPNDPNKFVPGVCGCGTADTNTDGDSQLDCNESCDADPNKTAPGACGCGAADTNTDGDSQADCNEACDTDPNKLAAGICGCGVADTDSDGDSVADCNDACPDDPAKTTLGLCGCGVAEGTCATANPLTGRYAVRSVLFNRVSNGDQVKAVGLSIVNVSADGTLSDLSCFAYTQPLNGGWWSWQKPANAQAIPPVVTTLTAQGSNFRREPDRNELGYRMSSCTGTGGSCPCEQATAGILIPPFAKPNPPTHCSLVDDDGDGIRGITAFGQRAQFSSPTASPSGLFSATLYVASSTASHWTITPNANGAGWHQATAADDGSYQNVVGCNSAGCSQLDDLANVTCPETWSGGSNKVWFRPIAGTPTHVAADNIADCQALVNQWNTPGYFVPSGTAPADGTICP